MTIISSGLLMISAAGITLGLVHLRFWFSQRERKDQLAFSLTCISLGTFAWFELGLMHAQSTAEYGNILKWAQTATAIGIISSAWFLKENLGARTVLFWSVVGLQIAGVTINLFLTPNINYVEISALGRVVVFGESLAYPIGTANPLSLIPQAGLIVLVIYATDACISAWRRGDQRKAIAFGTGSFVFAATVIGSVAVFWGLLAIPIIISASLLILAAPMLYELNYDMQRSAKLSDELLKRERELNESLDSTNLSAAAAHLGLWTRKAGEEEIYLSDKAREIFDFPPTGTPTFSDFASRVHPDDRDRLTKTIRSVEKSGGEYEIEYRLLLGDGRVKWIDSRGKAIAENGRPRTLHGASLDITNRKNAEATIHVLGGKLMDAQEKERARLARELHDDLSQRLALLSIRLEVLKGRPHSDFDDSHQIDELIASIQELSADVHRISHELHPAKLSQLGLEAALRGFCREVVAAHPLKVAFTAQNVPKGLPNHVSLCFYRLAQESLQNVIKHSRARSARVDLRGQDGDLVLAVSDDGTGFEPSTTEANGSLGIISMHERIAVISGTLTIDSRKGYGTRIEARVPLAMQIKANSGPDHR